MRARQEQSRGVPLTVTHKSSFKFTRSFLTRTDLEFLGSFMQEKYEPPNTIYVIGMTPGDTSVTSSQTLFSRDEHYVIRQAPSRCLLV